tara:strand:- start:573 stop:1169 length:597 start_codon:yes stop_codon:yes gene_type:complete
MSTVKKVATGPSAKDVKDNTLKAAHPRAVAIGKAIAKLEGKHHSDRLKMFEQLHNDVKGFKGDYKAYTDFRLTFGIAYATQKDVLRDSARRTFDRWIDDMIAIKSDNGNKLFKFEIPVKVIKAESAKRAEDRAEEAVADADGSGAKATEQDTAISLAATTREAILKYMMDHVKACRTAKTKPNQSALDKILGLAKKLS